MRGIVEVVVSLGTMTVVSSAALAEPIKCHGRDIVTLSTAPQFKPGLSQLDGTCYSYAVMAAIEAAYARKHGVLVQAFPVIAALRETRSLSETVTRIMQASALDEKTGTIQPIPVKSLHELALDL